MISKSRARDYLVAAGLAAILGLGASALPVQAQPYAPGDPNGDPPGGSHHRRDNIYCPGSWQVDVNQRAWVWVGACN